MSLSTPDFKKWPKAFLIAVLAILIYEAANYLFDDNFYSIKKGLPIDMAVSDGLRMKIKNELSQSKENRFDILILGDCYNIVGIIPKIIEENTGLSSYNFSTHMNHTILATYAMFQNYLKACSKKPQYMVIGYLPISSELGKNQIMKEMVQKLYDFRRGNTLLFLKEFGVAEGIKFLIPSLKHQEFFRNYLEWSTRNANKAELSEYYKQVALNQGYYPRKYNDVYKDEAKDEGGYEKFHASPFFIKYLKAILNLAKQNSIRVIYLIPSVPPDVYKLNEKYDVTKAQLEFASRLENDYSNLVVVNPQTLLNQKDFYSDRIHLNRKGATLLSAFLSDKINELKRKDLTLPN